MSSMTETQRSQLTRYDLQEERSTLTALSPRGSRILTGLTVVFIGVLAVLTYAAVQVFDGWHHLIVLADLGIIFIAVAIWLASGHPAAEAEPETAFIPGGLRPKA